MSDNQFKFSPSVLAWPLYFVLLLWVIYWIEVKYNIYLNDFGIYPRTLKGFRGILFSPFLHGSLEHLYNNSVALIVLLAALRYFYREQAFKVIIYGILLSGLFTWLIGRQSYHIGASGLIYVLVSFIFFKGIQSGYYRLVALSLIVVVIYGSMVWYIFPDVEEGISWEGHLGGFLTGLLFSRLFSTPDYKSPVIYEWQKPDFDPQQDPFMKRFDENGNFVNPPKPEPEEEDDEKHLSQTKTFPVIKIVYNYKPQQKEEGSSEEESNKNEI